MKKVKCVDNEDISVDNKDISVDNKYISIDNKYISVDNEDILVTVKEKRQVLFGSNSKSKWNWMEQGRHFKDCNRGLCGRESQEREEEF